MQKSPHPSQRRYSKAVKRQAVERTFRESCLDVAADLGCHRNTITQWRKLYAKGLLDDPSQPWAGGRA